MSLNSLLFGVTAIAFPAYAEMVGIEFNVYDFNGSPVQGAKIKFSSPKRPLVPFARSEIDEFECVTDCNGVATRRFDSWEGDISGIVKAAGYYNEPLPETRYRTSYDRNRDATIFFEKDKTVRVFLPPIKKPVPMYSYRAWQHQKRFGLQPFSCGYDLRLADWLPPVGHGEVADFYLVHSVTNTNGVVWCSANLTFPEGAGGYKVRNLFPEHRPIVYEADTNAVYLSSFDSSKSFSLATQEILTENKLADSNETLVIRSRVKLDAKGKVVSANYSKMYGPISIAGVFEFRQLSLNPVVNDPTLEFDLKRNLSKRKSGAFYP